MVSIPRCMGSGSNYLSCQGYFILGSRSIYHSTVDATNQINRYVTNPLQQNFSLCLNCKTSSDFKCSQAFILRGCMDFKHYTGCNWEISIVKGHECSSKWMVSLLMYIKLFILNLKVYDFVAQEVSIIFSSTAIRYGSIQYLYRIFPNILPS